MTKEAYWVDRFVFGPETTIDLLNRRIAKLEADAIHRDGLNAALIRRCAEQAHEIVALTIRLAEANAPKPAPSPTAFDAIQAMQRGGLR